MKCPITNDKWVGIIILFKWAAIGETPGQFFMGGGSKLCYKIFLYTLNTIAFDEEEKFFSNFAERP